MVAVTHSENVVEEEQGLGEERTRTEVHPEDEGRDGGDNFMSEPTTSLRL